MAVERVRRLYARIERFERRHAVLIVSDVERAADARMHRATRRLLEELTDIERRSSNTYRIRQSSTNV